MEEPTIEEISENLQNLDTLSKLIADIDQHSIEMKRLEDELETKKKLKTLARDNPALYKFLQMVERGDIEYEHALEKLVVHLVEANEELKEQLEEIMKRIPNRIV